MKILGSNFFKGGVVLPTYSRPHLLNKCLESVYRADNSKAIGKIIILQLGNKEVEKIVYKYANKETFIIPVIRSGTKPLFNMNYNWWIGASFGFEILGLEWVMSLEEESVVKNNIFNFTIEMHEKFRSTKKFKGVNLSTRLLDNSNVGTYSILRYGFMGSGATIIRNDWNKLKKLGVKRHLRNYPWDAFTEAFWKTGFRVTPNISMVMNYGWIDGTHSHKSDQDILNEKSFKIKDIPNNFQLKNVENGWRNDSHIYDAKKNYVYNIRFILWILLDNKLFKPIYKRLAHYFFN